MKIKNLMLAALTLSAILTSCGSDDDAPANKTITLDLTGLPALGNDYVYEGWLLVNNQPVSTGTFTSVDFPQSYSVDAASVNNATAFVLSIEPADDSDAAPSTTKVLSGNFTDNSAVVTSGVVADFSSAAGEYILATPTDADDTDANEASGVWFLNNSSDPATAGLTLPTLAAGWQYEGWVMINNTPVSTGTFTAVDMADDNAATAPYKGDQGDGPAFPGEDFVMGNVNNTDLPYDLRGNSAVIISVEPSPDNSAEPFALKPLIGAIPADAAVHTVISMGNEGVVRELTGTVTR